MKFVSNVGAAKRRSPGWRRGAGEGNTCSAKKWRKAGEATARGSTRVNCKFHQFRQPVIVTESICTVCEKIEEKIAFESAKYFARDETLTIRIEEEEKNVASCSLPNSEFAFFWQIYNSIDVDRFEMLEKFFSSYNRFVMGTWREKWNTNCVCGLNWHLRADVLSLVLIQVVNTAQSGLC